MLNLKLIDDNWTVAEPTPPGSENGSDIPPQNPTATAFSSSSYCSQIVWEPNRQDVCVERAELRSTTANSTKRRQPSGANREVPKGDGEIEEDNWRKRKPKQQQQQQQHQMEERAKTKSPELVRSRSKTPVQDHSQQNNIASHAIKISIDGVTPPPVRKKFNNSSMNNKESVPRSNTFPEQMSRKAAENGVVVMSKEAPADSRPASRRQNRTNQKTKFNTIDRTFFRSREEYEDFAEAVKNAAAAMSKMRQRNRSKLFGGDNSTSDEPNEEPTPVRSRSRASGGRRSLSPAKHQQQTSRKIQQQIQQCEESTSSSTAPPNGTYNVPLQTTASCTATCNPPIANR